MEHLGGLSAGCMSELQSHLSHMCIAKPKSQWSICPIISLQLFCLDCIFDPQQCGFQDQQDEEAELCKNLCIINSTAYYQDKSCSYVAIGMVSKAPKFHSCLEHFSF